MGLFSPRIRWLALANGADIFTLSGLIFAKLARAEITQRNGVWLAHSGALARWLRYHPVGAVDAMVVGRVIMARDSSILRGTLRHEWTHVRQFMRWGALFPYIYLLNSIWQVLRGKSYYLDNRFEKEAFANER